MTSWNLQAKQLTLWRNIQHIDNSKSQLKQIQFSSHYQRRKINRFSFFM